MKNAVRHSGFTLVEISIVLIIIALLAGSILVGRELILAAQIRQQVAQIEEMDTATMVFRQKYGCIPGDCPYATDFWGTFDGDGDGIVKGAIIPMYGEEPVHFWWELALAGLIHDGSTSYYGNPGEASPATKLEGSSVPSSLYHDGKDSGVWLGPYIITEPMNFAGTHFWLLTSEAFNQLGNNLPTGVFLPNETRSIDIKLDDGFPTTGKMRIATGIDANQLLYVNTTQNSGDEKACIDDRVPHHDQPVYNVTVRDRTANSLCMPVIKVAW